MKLPNVLFKRRRIFNKVLGCFIILCISPKVLTQQLPLPLWYDTPANYWEASLPLGNGRLGAMPDGGIMKENIVLNDITLWSGSKQYADKPDAYIYLPQIRQLLFEGKNTEAQQLMSRHFVCDGQGSGHGNGANVPYGSFQILGNLHILYDYGTDSTDIHVTNYYRELSLDSAIAKTQFIINNTLYSREYFTSFDDIIVITLSANQLRKINFTLTTDRPERFETKTQGSELQMYGRLNNGNDGKGM
jgi:alpha-L-fucosidase 2